MKYIFEDLTIGQIKQLTQEFLLQNPSFQTPEDLLEQVAKDRDGVFE